MIYEGSRYENASIQTSRGKNGDPAQAIYSYAIRGVTFNYRWYITKEGDRWDLLASRFFGDAEQWWRLAEANPEVYFPESTIPANTSVRVPSGALARR